MQQTQGHKELSRVPRTLSESRNEEMLDLLFEVGGTIMSDIIIFAGSTQMKDLFGDCWFSMEDFCKVMGYTRTKLQKKLTKEQRDSIFRGKSPVYLAEQNGIKIEHPIETVFETALYRLGIENLSVPCRLQGKTQYKFIQIIESFEIKDNFSTQKKTKRMYNIHLSKDLMNTLFNGYNLIDLKDYRNLPNRKGYRKFYLNLAKMIFLIKYKAEKGNPPNFIVTVNQLAEIFEVKIKENHDRKKKVTSILNAINKNLQKTKFKYEYVKNEGERWAYNIRFSFDSETLQYFDEKMKAVVSSQFHEMLKEYYLEKKGISRRNFYRYGDSFNFGTGEFYDEYVKWLYSDHDMDIKIETYKNAYLKILGVLPKDDEIVNLADIV